MRIAIVSTLIISLILASGVALGATMPNIGNDTTADNTGDENITDSTPIDTGNGNVITDDTTGPNVTFVEKTETEIPEQTTSFPTSVPQKSPGFESIFTIVAILSSMYIFGIKFR